jgi:hypothetical protein
MSHLFRPTSVGLAFVEAAMKHLHEGPKAPWTARRVMLNTERDGMGVVREQERINLSHKTASQLGMLK